MIERVAYWKNEGSNRLACCKGGECECRSGGGGCSSCSCSRSGGCCSTVISSHGQPILSHLDAIRSEWHFPACDEDWIAAWNDLYDLHANKSSTYGDENDRFSNFTAVAEATGQPAERYALLRIVEKAHRALNIIDGGDPAAVEEYPDLAALALVCEALRRKHARLR